MVEEGKAAEVAKLPRLTTFSAEPKQPISAAYYQKALFFLSKLNSWLNWLMIIFVMIALLLLVKLIETKYSNAYVSDGLLGCTARELTTQEENKLGKGGSTE